MQICVSALVHAFAHVNALVPFCDSVFIGMHACVYAEVKAYVNENGADVQIHLISSSICKLVAHVYANVDVHVYVHAYVNYLHVRACAHVNVCVHAPVWTCVSALVSGYD